MKIYDWFLMPWIVGLILICIGIGIIHNSFAIGLISVGTALIVGLILPIVLVTRGVVTVIDTGFFSS